MMSGKILAAQVTVVGVPVGNVLTDNGVINALHLENMVWMGLTYGAWFKVVAIVSVVLMIVVNLQTIFKNWRNDSPKRPKETEK